MSQNLCSLQDYDAMREISVEADGGDFIVSVSNMRDKEAEPFSFKITAQWAVAMAGYICAHASQAWLDERESLIKRVDDALDALDEQKERAA